MPAPWHGRRTEPATRLRPARPRWGAGRARTGMLAAALRACHKERLHGGFAEALPPTPAAGCIAEPQRDDDVRPWGMSAFGRAVVSAPCAPPMRPGHLPTSEAS